MRAIQAVVVTPDVQVIKQKMEGSQERVQVATWKHRPCMTGGCVCCGVAQTREDWKRALRVRACVYVSTERPRKGCGVHVSEGREGGHRACEQREARLGESLSK